jgi:hypothetical protein
MTDDDVELVFDLGVAEPDAEIAHVEGCASTPETKARYTFLKTRFGSVWQEGHLLYRQGRTGITVLNFNNERTRYDC